MKKIAKIVSSILISVIISVTAAVCVSHILSVDTDKDDSLNVSHDSLVKMVANPANLLTREVYTIETGKTGYGVTIDIDDNGVITFDGTNTHTTVINLELGKIDLKAGTYYFSQGNEFFNIYNFAVVLFNDSTGSKIMPTTNNKEGFFTLTSDTSVTIKFYLGVNYFNDVNRTFEPVLALSDEPVSFWVEELDIKDPVEESTIKFKLSNGEGEVVDLECSSGMTWAEFAESYESSEGYELIPIDDGVFITYQFNTLDSSGIVYYDDVDTVTSDDVIISGHTYIFVY